jgi:colanic acid/amylovoran biosynthesis protein
MNIIISHVYSNDNKGDAALLSVLISDIRRAFDNPHITVLTMDKIKKDEIFEKVDVKNGFMYYVSDYYTNPFYKMMHAIFVTMATFMWAYVYRYFGQSIPLPQYLEDVCLLYRDADLVIPVGGGYIRGKSGFMDTVILFFIIHPLLFTYVLHKPTINYSQSVGPFGNKFQEYMAKFAIKKVTGIIVREKITLDLLKKWGVTKNVLLSVDSGFLFTSNSSKDLRKEFNIPAQQMIVGVTVRKWLASEAQKKYEVTVAQLCDYIIKKYNAIVIFIPQVTVENHADDDRESSKRVYSFIEQKKNVRVMTERYDHQTIKALYGGLDYLVGTRFHSVIFALTSYVPSIAVEYEHKTRGIMRDLGLEKWVVDIRKTQISQLIDLFDQLVLHQYQYIDQLKKVLPSYIEQSKKSIYFVKKMYERMKDELIRT